MPATARPASEVSSAVVVAFFRTHASGLDLFAHPSATNQIN